MNFPTNFLHFDDKFGVPVLQVSNLFARQPNTNERKKRLVILWDWKEKVGNTVQATIMSQHRHRRVVDIYIVNNSTRNPLQKN